MTHYHYLTIEQRESLQTAMKGRIDALRRDIGAALRQSGNPDAISLANHLDETDDEPVADLELALEIATLEREVSELRAYEAALERLHTPDYGVCADCGIDIPFARLDANPVATRCIECQSRNEREHGVTGSPKL